MLSDILTRDATPFASLCDQIAFRRAGMPYAQVVPWAVAPAGTHWLGRRHDGDTIVVDWQRFRGVGSGCSATLLTYASADGSAPEVVGVEDVSTQTHETYRYTIRMRPGQAVIRIAGNVMFLRRSAEEVWICDDGTAARMAAAAREEADRAFRSAK